MGAPTEVDQVFGSLVAVEGSPDGISTQLRLLPPSSKILIMPPLMEVIQQFRNHDTFDPRTFIHGVHQSLSTRVGVARSFLREATIEQPRLVFMNGGSLNARMICVTTISERFTDGDIRSAEKLFEEIAADGVAGLMKREKLCEIGDKTARYVEEEQNLDGMEEAAEDPSTVAMKAAESLDRETVQFQVSSEDEVEEYEILSASEGKFFVNGEIPNVGEAMFTGAGGPVNQTTIITIPSSPSDTIVRRHTFGELIPTSPKSNYDDAMPYQNDDGGDLSPLSRCSSAPLTPGLVEIGEAYIVNVGTTSIRRIKSVDRFATRKPTSILLGPSPRIVRSISSLQDLKSDNSFGSEAGIYGHRTLSRSLEMLPRTTFVRASKALIRRTPPFSRRVSFEPDMVNEERKGFQNPEMVDATTQAPDDTPEQKSFEPIFPVVEDLVLHFTEGTPNEILEAMIRSYKDGSYPAVPSKSSNLNTAAIRSPYPSAVDKQHLRPLSCMTAETDDEDYHRRQEIDIFNPDVYNINPLWLVRRESKTLSNTTAKAQPPTPASTPPPMVFEMAQKFQKVSPFRTKTAISMQNSLRSILNTHFPPETAKYRQFTYPDDGDRLWKPVFRNDYGMEDSNVDQIIAIGCEDGVREEFFNDLVGQVGKLGTKKSGVSRTGKLDIRYLISTAMQSYTAQSSIARKGECPLSDPAILATLLVNQLETYLSINDSSRLLLLTYSASHLATVFALRQLLGSELVKVAGIVDSSSIGSTDSPSTPKATPNILSNEGAAFFNSRHRSRNSSSPIKYSPSISAESNNHTISPYPSTSFPNGRPSFAKANYLLPSTATPSELSTFLKGIQSCLIGVSAFYTPEQEPVFPGVPAPPPIPTSNYPSETANRPRSPKMRTSTLKGSNTTKKSFSSDGNATRHKATKSTTSTITRERRSEKEWENFAITGEESEDEDADARRLMPRVVCRELRNVNPRKALKFLGLA